MQDGPLPAISRVVSYNSTYRPFIRSFIGISHISLFNYSGHIFVYKMWFTFYEGIPIVLAFTIHYEPVFGQSRSHGENFRKHFAFVQDTQKHFFFKAKNSCFTFESPLHKKQQLALFSVHMTVQRLTRTNKT